jgi:hypothetical protein
VAGRPPYQERDDAWREIVLVEDNTVVARHGVVRPTYNATCRLCRSRWRTASLAHEADATDLAVVHRNLHRGLDRILRQASAVELKQIWVMRGAQGDEVTAHLAMREWQRREGTLPADPVTADDYLVMA